MDFFFIILINTLHYVIGQNGIFTTTNFVPIKSAARVRLSDGTFQQISRITSFLYNRQINNVVIPQQQQCFPEGCVQIYGFQVTAHRPPNIVLIMPNPPNRISLSIRDFDIYVTGSLSGQLQPLLPLPIAVPAAGTLSVSSSQLGIVAIMDIQKMANGVPYVRVVSCGVNEGNIAARVENMGLITEIVNAKYQNEINVKARETMQTTICSQIQKIVANEFSSRLARIPSRMSVKELFDTFMPISDSNRRRHRRALPVRGPGIATVVEVTRVRQPPSRMQASNRPSNFGSMVSNQVRHSPSSPNIRNSNLDVQSPFFNSRKLANLIIDMNILDSSATYEKFFVGVNGDVYVVNEPSGSNPYPRPSSLKFPLPSYGRMVELLVSEYTINTLLLKAHNIGALVFRIGSDSPVFGKLLRTSCSLDEVCLTDIVSEPGEKYPNRQLEVIVRSSGVPQVQFAFGRATLHMDGRALFYLEGTTQKVGVIPFEATAIFNLTTVNGLLIGSLSIPHLILKDNIDFFGLSADSLSGLRDATRGALQNMVNAKLKDGILLRTRSDSHFIGPAIIPVNGAILIQADVDIEKDFYNRPNPLQRRFFNYNHARS